MSETGPPQPGETSDFDPAESEWSVEIDPSEIVWQTDARGRRYFVTVHEIDGRRVVLQHYGPDSGGPKQPGDPGFVRFHEDPEAPGRGRFVCEYLIDGWAVGGTYWLSPQGLVMTSVWLAPKDPEAGLTVTTALLRSVKPAEMLSAIRLRYTWGETKSQGVPGLEVRKQPGRKRSRQGDPRKQAQLRRIAIAYLAEQHDRGAHKRLAARFRITPEQVKARIRAARADGWLAAGAVSGSRGAEPGPRLLADPEFTESRKEQPPQ